MIWTSALSENSTLAEAIADCSSAIKATTDGQELDLVTVFISPHHEDSYDKMSDLLAESFTAKHIFGCSGGGVIGNGIEIEQ